MLDWLEKGIFGFIVHATMCVCVYVCECVYECVCVCVFVFNFSHGHGLGVRVPRVVDQIFPYLPSHWYNKMATP